MLVIPATYLDRSGDIPGRWPTSRLDIVGVIAKEDDELTMLKHGAAQVRLPGPLEARRGEELQVDSVFASGAGRPSFSRSSAGNE